jgi:hypothetical protein
MKKKKVIYALLATMITLIKFVIAADISDDLKFLLRDYDKSIPPNAFVDG